MGACGSRWDRRGTSRLHPHAVITGGLVLPPGSKCEVWALPARGGGRTRCSGQHAGHRQPTATAASSRRTLWTPGGRAEHGAARATATSATECKPKDPRSPQGSGGKSRAGGAPGIGLKSRPASVFLFSSRREESWPGRTSEAALKTPGPQMPVPGPQCRVSGGLSTHREGTLPRYQGGCRRAGVVSPPWRASGQRPPAIRQHASNPSALPAP